MARLSRPQDPRGLRLHSGPVLPPDALPDIPEALLDHLDTVFPDRLDVAWRDMGEVREACGARKVVDHLRALRAHHQQQET